MNEWRNGSHDKLQPEPQKPLDPLSIVRPTLPSLSAIEALVRPSWDAGIVTVCLVRVRLIQKMSSGTFRSILLQFAQCIFMACHPMSMDCLMLGNGMESQSTLIVPRGLAQPIETNPLEALECVRCFP